MAPLAPLAPRARDASCAHAESLNRRAEELAPRDPDLPFDDLTHGLDAGLLNLKDGCEEPVGTPGDGKPGSGNPVRLRP